MLRMLVTGGLVFVAVVLVLAGRPAAGLAHGEIALDVDVPSHVAMPDGALLGISVSPSAQVSTGIWDHSFNYVGGCSANCDARVMTGLLQGGSHAVTETFYLQAFGPDQHDSTPVYETVTFDPPDWQVSLDLPDEASMPDSIPATIAATPSIFSTHSVDLINADNSQWTGLSCATDAGSCTGSLGTGWLGGTPVIRHYRAELKDGATTMAAVTKAVTIYPPSIGVTIAVPPFVLPGHTYKVKVTNTYNQWTPYTIEVRNATGTVIGYCAVQDTTCEFTLTADAQGGGQSYTAAVTYGSDVVSQTSTATVDFTDPATADANDGIDISDLAGLFGSSAAVCDSLLFFPGTHVQNTSTTDQENACVLASQASGATAEDVIRAALAAMAAAGIAVNGQSLLAWLQHWAWTNYGTAPPWTAPPPTAPSPPTATPAPVASAADALADDLMAKNAALATAGATVALTVARACLHLTGEAGFSGGLCHGTPIFVPGATHPAATNFRIHALTEVNPLWVRLARRIGKRDNWYLSQPECAGRTVLMNCDEFPENRTYQGGNPYSVKPRPYLGLVNAPDNQGLGGALGNFVTTCAISDGGDFLVIPIPPVLGIPTMSNICN